MVSRKKPSSVKKNLYKLGNSWYILKKIRQPDGSFKQKRTSFGADKRAAELALAELNKQCAIARVSNDWSGLENLTKPKSKKTFAEAAQDYLDDRQHGKASTLRTYNEHLKNYLLPEFGEMPISAITEKSVATFQARIANKLSACRTNSTLNLLRAILKVCVRRKLIAENPADGVNRLREAKTLVDPLKRDELDLVLLKISEHYRPLFTCLAWTGARPGELLALRWNDIDMTREEIRINKARVKGQEALPKTSSAERVIPMLPPVVLVLKALKTARSVTTLNGTDHVFIGKNGKPIDRTLDSEWATAVQRAGLRHRPSYQLRHTFASICLQQGVEPGWIANVLGHSTIQQTFRHYARYIPDDKKQNEKLVNALFASTPVSMANTASK